MANTEIDPFAYNPAAAASVFGALPPQAAPEEVDISQYLPQAATQAQPMQGRSSSYDEAFQQAESQYGLPSGLLSTIGFHESRFNPNAVSPAGAEGLMQLMPPTAREYGVNARDPYASIDAAGKKMAGLVKYYNGDMAKAVAAYNYGEGNLNRAIRKAGDNWISAVPRETQYYVSKVLGGQQQGPQEETYDIPLSNGGTLHAPKGMSREEAIAEARAHGLDAVGLRDVPLANGGTLHVPDDMSDEEAVKQASEGDPSIDFTLAKKETADRTTGGFFRDVGATTLKGVTSLAQSVIGLADIITPGDLGAAVENNIVDLSKYQDYLDKQFSPQTQEAIKNLNEAHGLGNILQAAKDNPSAVLSMIGQAAPQMVGAVGPAKAALFGLGKLAGVAPSLAPAIAKYGSYAAAGTGEGAVATGGAKENLRTTNPEGEATGANTIAALGTGAGTALFGGAGAKLTTALGGVDPTMFLMGGKQAAINAVGDIANTPGFFKSTLVSMVGEGVLEEAPQSAVEQVFQNYAEGKTGEGLLEGVPDSAFKGALIGAVMGGGINVGSRIAQPAVQPPPPPPPAGQEPPIAGEVPEVPATTTTEPLFTAEDEALLAASEAKGKKGKAAVVPLVSEAPAAMDVPAGVAPVVAPVSEVPAGVPPVVVPEAVPVAPEVVPEVVPEVAPVVRAKPEKVTPTQPTWLTETLGLPKSSSVYKQIATKGLDINKPEDHAAIDKVLAPLSENKKITDDQWNKLDQHMEAIQQGQTTPTPIQEAPNAVKIPEATTLDVSSSTQPKVRQKGKSAPISSEGVREGGPESGQVEAVTEEKVTPKEYAAWRAPDTNDKSHTYNSPRTALDLGNYTYVFDTVSNPDEANKTNDRDIHIYKRGENKEVQDGQIGDNGVSYIRSPKFDARSTLTETHIDKNTPWPSDVPMVFRKALIQHAGARTAKQDAISQNNLMKVVDQLTEDNRAEQVVLPKGLTLATNKPVAKVEGKGLSSVQIEANRVADLEVLRLKKQEEREDKQARGVPLEPMDVRDTGEAREGDINAVIGKAAKPTVEDLAAKIAAVGEKAKFERETLADIKDKEYISTQGEQDYSVAPTSETTEHTAASLSKTLSPEMKRLVASGKAVMHDTAETLPEGKHPANVQGLTTAEGVTHYVANKLTPETLENVALHEVGTHVGMENLVGAKVYKDITHQALNNVGEVFDKARASIPKDTPTHLRHREALAYLVENAPNLPVVKKIVSAVRNFARMHLGMKLQLTEADARHLAVKALRRESKTAVRTARKEGTAYSLKGPSQAAKDLGKIVADANLVKTSDKKPLDSVKEGVENAIKQSTLTRLRKSWIDASAGLSKALSSLPSMSLKGELRADLLHSKNQQLYNLVRTSFEKGYLVLSEDGGLMSTDDSELALNNIFKRIDELGYPDSRKTFFTAMRVMAGESNLLHDAHQRGLAQRYEKYVKLRKKEIDTLTGKERTKLINKLNGLKAEAKRIYERAGKKSLTDMQDEITTKTALAQKKEALAAATADPITKAKLTDAAAKLREAIDKLSEKTESGGVGTEKRVDAQHILDTKKLLASDDRLEPIMADIYAALHKSVDLWEQSGLIDSDTANNWRENPAYIPLYKSIDDLLEDPSKYVQVLKSGAKALGKVNAREGGLHDVNVGENLVKHFAFMAGAAAQNQYRKIASYQLASVGGAKISGPDDPQATKFKEDGKDVYYHIEDPVAFEAFQVAIPVLGAFSKVAQQYTKVFRGVTLINPVYWYRQLIRDPMMANLVSQTGFITPLHSLKAMAEILTNRSKSYETLKKHGVVGAVDSLTDPAQFVKAAATKRGTGRKFKDWIMHVHESSDAATRVAVYDKALKDAAKRGMVGEHAENYAVMRSREIINFSKKGNSQSLAAIRATVPFFSAQLNGMDTLARAAMPGKYGNLNKEEAAQARKHFYTNAAILTTISMSWALLLQDDEEYRKSPDWVNSWLVPTGNKDHPFFKIPIPFEAGFFFKVIPELIVRLNSGTMSQAQAEKELGKAAIGLLAPSFPLPQILKPMAEVATNYDIHTGNTIENFSESMLPMEQRSAHASNLAKLLGEYLPISPDNVEHLGRGWFTEAWAMSAALSDAYLSKGVSAPEKEWGEMPMLKGIFTAPGKDRALSEYYAASKSATQIRNAIMAANKVGDRETVEAIKSDPDKLKQFKASSVLQDMGTSISAMQHNIKRIKAMKDTEVTPEEKAKRIRVVQDRINNLAQKALVVGKRFGLDL